MRRLHIALAAAAGAAVLAVPGIATAAPRTVTYRYSGTLVTDPGANATQVSLLFRNGNARALRSLIGTGVKEPLTFTLGSQTTFYIASGRTWKLGSSADLQGSDPVTVVIRSGRARRYAALARVPARAVWDRAGAERATGVLYHFWGTVSGVDTAAHHLAVTVLDGNHRALRLMLGQPQAQVFSYDGATVFVHWTHGIPVIVDPGSITAGERLSVRIRAPKGSDLATVEATPARIVGVHDPAPADG